MTAEAILDARTRPRPLALFAGALAFLLPVAYSTGIGAPFFTLRAALLLVATGVGLPLLVFLLRSDARAPAAAAIAFVAAAGLSTLLSEHPLRALTGPYGAGTGALFAASLASIWAIGRVIGRSAAGPVITGLILAGALNGVVAVAQRLVDLDVIGLAPFAGRSHGLTGNPVHLGVLETAVLALLGFRAGRDAKTLALTVCVGAGLTASGSRLAGLVGLAVLLFVAAVKRREAAAVLLAAVVGMTAGQLLSTLDTGPSVLARLNQEGVGEESTLNRVYTWSEARHALAERPLLGHGPGQYLAATAPHRDLRLARNEPDSYFRDAHNFVVEYAVTTGLVGLACLAVFIALALRSTAPDLRAFCLVALVMLLAQPMFPATTPLAFLALGAASTTALPALPRISIAVGAVLAALGAAAGATLVVGDLRLYQAYLDYSPNVGRQADRLLPRWPDSASIIARMYVFYGTSERKPELLESAIAWHRRAALRDPGDPRWWNELGYVQLTADDVEGARASFSRAVTNNPYSHRALYGLTRTDIAAGACDDAEARIEEIEQIFAEPQKPLRDELENCRG